VSRRSRFRAGRASLHPRFCIRGPVSGRITVEGNVLPPASPRAAQQLGVGVRPRRPHQGGSRCSLCHAENLTLAGVGQLANGGFVHRDGERKLVAAWVEKINVVPRDPRSGRCRKFSGGNQQKVILARGASAWRRKF